MKYTFADWVSQNVPEDAPPDEMLADFPAPPKLRNYHPAWGKGSKSAAKAVITRNANEYAKAKETFRREVLPVLRGSLDSESLFDTGKDLEDCALIRQSGFQFYALEDRGSWLAPNDSRIPQALAMGAAPIEPETYFANFTHRNP